MDNLLFYNSFKFFVHSFNKSHHTNNSAGITIHFLARMRRGKGRIVTERGEELLLKAGDFFYLPQGLRYHSYWTPEKKGDSVVEWESCGFDVYPCKSGKSYAMQKLAPSPTALQYWENIDPARGVSASSVGHLYAFWGEIHPTMIQTENDPQKELFSKAKNFIHQNPHFKVRELARHCGMSESGLYAFFRSYANTSPIEVKNRVQAQRAIELLGSTDLPIESVSDLVGFRSVAYFRRILRTYTGKTPGEIRQEQFKKHSL